MAKKTPTLIDYPDGLPDPPSSPPPEGDTLAALVSRVEALREEVRVLADTVVLDISQVLGTLQQLRREVAALPKEPQAPPWYRSRHGKPGA